MLRAGGLATPSQPPPPPTNHVPVHILRCHVVLLLHVGPPEIALQGKQASGLSQGGEGKERTTGQIPWIPPEERSQWPARQAVPGHSSCHHPQAAHGFALGISDEPSGDSFTDKPVACSIQHLSLHHHASLPCPLHLPLLSHFPTTHQQPRCLLLDGHLELLSL